MTKFNFIMCMEIYTGQSKLWLYSSVLLVDSLCSLVRLLESCADADAMLYVPDATKTRTSPHMGEANNNMRLWKLLIQDMYSDTKVSMEGLK